jgi:polysaccharide biosynthesis transport protein
MNSIRHNEQPAAGLSLVDIYFVVFRHKWKIIILTLAGLVAAGYFYYTKQPAYQSDAELLVRYVTDAHSMNLAANNSQMISMLDQSESVMKAEMALITSFDLAASVATNIGPDKILAKAGGGNDPIAAASTIRGNLKVEGNDSTIHIIFTSPDPTIVQQVLGAVVIAYMDKSDQVHRAIDLSDDEMVEQTEQLKQALKNIDQQLWQAKENAGVIDVSASEKSLSDERDRLSSEIFDAQTELAEHQATANDQMGKKSGISTNLVSSPPAPADQLDKYKTTLTRLAYLQKTEDGYLQQGFTDDNKLVKETRDQIAAATKIKTDLETNYPALAEMEYTAPDSKAGSTDASTGTGGFSSLPIRIKMLQDRLAQVQSAASKLGEAESTISDLERQRQIQADSYKGFASSLQEERIKSSLGPGKNSNIQQIQSPSPPYKDFKKFYRTFGALLVSGLFAGLGWACLIEFYLDRSVKRPIEIQNKLKIPFFLSIPDLNHKKRGRFIGAGNRRQLAYKNGADENGVTVAAKDGSLEVMNWEINRRFDSYYDALRDRLVVYFESINLTRKPKLVAVTSTHKGAGVSTIASGLAASLSETGDGRVLLVDMNQEHGAAQQFFQGRANCKLDDALESEKRDGALVQENLYVVSEDTFSDKLPRALPKRFASLIPKLKASDYDYIIFDMPPVSPTSVTARLAGFMDTVMLVIESEKTDQQVVQQANALLAQSKANVTAVLNKTKHYIPSRLHQDFLSDV